MDFKSLMAAQIAKSKPPSKGSSPSDTKPVEPTSKYKRRAEIEKEREAAYIAEQARLERERSAQQDRKRKLDEEEAERNAIREEKKRKLAEESRVRREAEEAEQERLKRKRLGLPERPPSSSAAGDGEADGTTPGPEDMPEMPDDEVRSKLRALDQPAVLYEEDHNARLKRYYKLTAIRQARPKTYPGPIPTTLEPVAEQDMLLPSNMRTLETTEHPLLARQISSYLTLLLSAWSESLAQRSPSDAESSAGIAASNSYATVLRDLTPLFRRLEATAGQKSPGSGRSGGGSTVQQLPSDILTPLVEILRACQDRRYRDAVDGYLRLSIGKAAWPIGVTMVGIHERSAREKLHGGGSGDDKTAHIMQDESTRKMLQSVKRCVSFAQVRWPPSDVGQLMG